MSLRKTITAHWKRLLLAVLLAAVGLFTLRHAYGIVQWQNYDGPVRTPRHAGLTATSTFGAGRGFVPEQLDRLLTAVENVCRRRGLRLHYMTAREAYNVVKAAEDGRTGNPEDYRNWRIARPLNVVAALGEPPASGSPGVTFHVGS